jgi:23S rRNA pseudouridine2605 synthase
MARPRKSSRGSSFGSDAEKSFRSKRKSHSGRGDAERPRSSYSRNERSFPASQFSKGSKPLFEKREEDSERSPGFKKSFDSRRKNADGPFRKSYRKTEGDSPSRFGKSSFQKRSEGDSGSGSFRKRSPASFGSKNERSSPYGKKPFQKRAAGETKPFRRRSESPDRSQDENTSFGKRSFVKREGAGKPFVKKERGASFEGKKTDGERGRQSFVKSRLQKARTPRRQEAEKPTGDPDLIRLNKFLANSGVGSRREADELIRMGLVTVNGVTITEMGHKVKITDEVRYEGKKLKAEKPVYILLNKPKGFITTTDDPQERNTVMNIVAGACKERIYPVGRLDRNTTGLLLLTNDGDLADKLTHPSYNVKKIYKVELDKPITKNDFQKIQEGVHLEEGRAIVDDLAIVSDDKKTIGIELHIGWNRIVRRIFESLGYEVVRLDRVVYAGLDKKDLGRGQWRFLKPEEVVMLKHFK